MIGVEAEFKINPVEKRPISGGTTNNSRKFILRRFFNSRKHACRSMPNGAVKWVANIR